MTTTAFSVTLAVADDAALIGNLLADAFYEDPVGRWLDPDDTTRTGRLARLFELWATAFTLPHGEVRRAGDGGVALWLPPGRWQVPPLVLLRHLPRLGWIFGRRTTLLLRGLSRVETHHPREAHWYLPFIGVTRQRRRRSFRAPLRPGRRRN